MWNQPYSAHGCGCVLCPATHPGVLIHSAVMEQALCLALKIDVSVQTLKPVWCMRTAVGGEGADPYSQGGAQESFLEEGANG